MKGVKLKPLLVLEDQILVKPPDLLSTTRDIDNNNWKNCTFSTVDQLKDILKYKRISRQSKILSKEEDHEQVEKLNHWRHNSSAQSPTPSKKYTFRRKLSVNYDPSTIVSISAAEFLKSFENPIIQNAFTIINEERQKNKRIKSEYSKISQKNKFIIDKFVKNLEFLTEEIEKVEVNVKKGKENVFKLEKELESVEIAYENESKSIKQQEVSVMLVTRNLHFKKLFKLGETNEYFLFREKLRQQKQNMHNEYTLTKEKLVGMIQEQEKERDNWIITKRDLKRELDSVKSTLATAYLKILRQGMDVREEGLRWVIKRLWELEESIPLSSFPKFLDEDSSQFLLTMAKHDLELVEYNARLNSTRTKIKEERSLKGVPKNAGELYLNVKDRLKKISNSVVAEPIKKNSDVNETTVEVVEYEKNTFANELTWIRENIERINKVMENITQIEAHRVTKVYKSSPSEVGLAHIFRVLVGDKSREFMKLAQL